MEIIDDITIAAPVEAVFSVFTDLSRRAERVSRVTEIQILEGGTQMQPGVRWRETKMVNNKPLVQEWRVTSLTPNANYVIDGSDPDNQYHMELTFVQVKAETTVQLAFESKPITFASNMMNIIELFGNMTKKGMHKELEELKAACEQAQGGAPSAAAAPATMPPDTTQQTVPTTPQNEAAPMAAPDTPAPVTPPAPAPVTSEATPPTVAPPSPQPPAQSVQPQQTPPQQPSTSFEGTLQIQPIPAATPPAPTTTPPPATPQPAPVAPPPVAPTPPTPPPQPPANPQTPPQQQ